MKTLVLSDIHYPSSNIGTVRKIIMKEKPDYVVLLGDIVEDKSQHREFARQYKKIFPMEKTAYLLGDNDYDEGEFFKGIRSMNKSMLEFSIGNMVFMHGNIGYSRKLEHIGLAIGKRMYAWKKFAFPFFVGLFFRLRKGIGNRYLFLGHIHVLKNFPMIKTTFCGTLKKERIIYGKNDSLGYVVIMHNESFIAAGNGIRLKRLRKG